MISSISSSQYQNDLDILRLRTVLLRGDGQCSIVLLLLILKLAASALLRPAQALNQWFNGYLLP